MKRLAPVAAPITVVAVLLLLVAGLWEGGKHLFAYLAGVPKELGAAIVAASATIFVSTLTVVIGRYFERKKDLDALYRDKKVEIYDDFLKRFFSVLWGTDSKGDTEDLVPFLREFMRKLILWSGPDAIASFAKWRQHMARGVPDAETIFLTEEFLLALRDDLRHNNRGISKGFFAQLYLKEPDLFLSTARLNPKITLAELAALEKKMSTGMGESGAKTKNP
jgi:hypothetical protein